MADQSPMNREPADKQSAGRGRWGSRFGFILAASGSAVGLGNLWKFPYIAYSNGGGASGRQGAGAFVIMYIIAVLAVGLPIMVAEIMIGRRGKRNPVGAFKALRPGTLWKAVGALGILTGFVLLSYYNVVAGWTLEYSLKAVTNEFSTYDSQISDDELRTRLWKDFKDSAESLGPLEAAGYGEKLTPPSPGDEKAKVEFRVALKKAWKTVEEAAKKDPAKKKVLAALLLKYKTRLWTELEAQPDAETKKSTLRGEILPAKLFADFLGNPWKQVGWSFAFMLLSVLVVFWGVSHGIERATKLLMPAFVVLLLFLFVRMLTLKNADLALQFLFQPNFEHVNSSMVLSALGHAFFTLSLGMGAIITYGSYLSDRENILRTGLAVTLVDTAVALMASIIIFSAIFSYDLVMEGSGTGNLFTAIPVIFMKMGQSGVALTVAFYLLVLFAALTSTISLLEVVVSYLIDEWRWGRKKATVVVGSVVFGIGVPSALSNNVLKDVHIFGMTWFDLADYLCANWFLPVGGLFVAIFAGWALTRSEQREELPENQVSAVAFAVWRVLVRYVAPLAVLAVLLNIVFGLGG